MTYIVNFRGRQACPCLAAWLPVYEAELQRRKLLTGPLKIYQLIGNASASADTHSQGGAFDISDLPGREDLVVARQMGADATWSRTKAQGFSTPHIHGVLTGCPHNAPARYQIDAVRAGKNGLASGGADDGPRPLSGRTWREGIAWAKAQQVPPPTRVSRARALLEDALKRAKKPTRKAAIRAALAALPKR